MNNKGYALIELVFVIFAFFALIGEIKCVYKFFSCDFAPSYKAEIIYGFGTLSGFGGIIGYMDFGK